MSDEAHCALGVCFVGLAGREIKKLLHDVQSPFRRQPRSRMSTKSTQSYVDSLTVGRHASDVAWQSTHTGLCVPTLTVGYAPLDVARRPPDSRLALHVPTSPGTHHVPLSLDDSPLATVCAVAPLGPLLSTPRLDNVFATTTTFSVNDEEGTVVFDFEPATSPLSGPTVPSRQESGSNTTEEEDAYPTLQNVFDAAIKCAYDDKDEEVVFDYSSPMSVIPFTNPSGSECLSSGATSLCGFPGDSLVDFACGFLCTAGKLLPTLVTPSWPSSSPKSSVQPQNLSKLSLPTPTVCPRILYPCADHLTQGINVPDVTQCPSAGPLNGDCVPRPTDNSTPQIVAVETSPLATSLMSQVALLGYRDLAHSSILHPPAVPVHAACPFAICDQCACFDPGGVLLVVTTASHSMASATVDPTSLAADLNVVDGILLPALLEPILPIHSARVGADYRYR